jgi:hypothetical protein
MTLWRVDRMVVVKICTRDGGAETRFGPALVKKDPESNFVLVTLDDGPENDRARVLLLALIATSLGLLGS